MVKRESRCVFGEKLRAVRERKGLTMKQVAERIAVSESLICQIERNKVSPSIETLLSIADTLEIDLDYLFRDFKKNKPVEIVRRTERHSRTIQGVTYYQLSAMTDSSEEYGIGAVRIEIEVGAERGNSEYGHPGKELGVILSGEGRLTYGTESYILKEGDSVSFASDIPHILKNAGKKKLVALWINTPSKMIG